MPKNTAKLRIAYVLDGGLDSTDGVQQYVLTLDKWMQSRGHYVRHLVGESHRKDIDNYISMCRSIKVRFNGNILTIPLAASPFKVRKVLAKEKFDIIHVQTPHHPFMGAQVVHFGSKKSKIIGTFHILPIGAFHYVASWFLGRILWFNYKKFNHIFSVSEPARVFAKQTFGIKTTTLPNVIDLEKFKIDKPKNSSDKISIVFLGRLVPRKGCMELLKAIDLLYQREPGLKFDVHIGGTGSEEQNLKNFVVDKNLVDLVHFYGFVAEAKKPEFLAQADIAVFPAYGGESFGIVLIEAMAAGAGAILGGNNPGYASVLSDIEECLFDPKNTEELTDLLLKIINHKELASEIHAKQQRLVKQFDVNIVGKKLLDVYNSKK